MKRVNNHKKFESYLSIKIYFIHIIKLPVKSKFSTLTFKESSIFLTINI